MNIALKRSILLHFLQIINKIVNLSMKNFCFFSEAILSHDYRLFMLESAAKEKIPLEERVIIDPDLCEIY